MQLLVFTVIGLLSWITAYAFSLGGTLGTLIFLFFVFTGVLIRWAEPILERLRP